MDNHREFEPSLWPWWWWELPNLLYNTCGYNDVQLYQVSKPFVQHAWLQWCTTISSFQTFCTTRVVTMMCNHIKFPNLLYNTRGYNDAQPYQVSKPFVQHAWLWWYATISSFQTFCTTCLVMMICNHIKFPNLLYNTLGYDDTQLYQVSKPFVQHSWLWWSATIPSLQTRKVSRKLSALLLSLTRLVSQRRWPCTEQGIRTYTESLPAASLGEFPSTDSSFSLCVKQDADPDSTWSDSSSAGKKRKKKEGGSLQTKQNGTVKKDSVHRPQLLKRKERPKR